MIDHLVDTTRLTDEDARLFFHHEPMDLAAVLHDVCRLQREISAGAQIQQDFAVSLPMQGDPKLLFQAFGNLVANGIKYSPSRPVVVLQASRHDKHITNTIADYGIGIPQKDRELIVTRTIGAVTCQALLALGLACFWSPRLCGCTLG